MYVIPCIGKGVAVYYKYTTPGVINGLTRIALTSYVVLCLCILAGSLAQERYTNLTHVPGISNHITISYFRYVVTFPNNTYRV